LQPDMICTSTEAILFVGCESIYNENASLARPPNPPKKINR